MQSLQNEYIYNRHWLIKSCVRTDRALNFTAPRTWEDSKVGMKIGVRFHRTRVPDIYHKPKIFSMYDISQTLNFLRLTMLFDFIPLIHTFKNAHLVMYKIWPRNMTAKDDKMNTSSHVICLKYCIGVGCIFSYCFQCSLLTRDSTTTSTSEANMPGLAFSFSVPYLTARLKILLRT